MRCIPCVQCLICVSLGTFAGRFLPCVPVRNCRIEAYFFAPEASRYSRSAMTSYLCCEDPYRVKVALKRLVSRAVVFASQNQTEAVRDVTYKLYKLHKA